MEAKKIETTELMSKISDELYSSLRENDTCGRCVSSLDRDELAAVYYYTTEHDYLSYRNINHHLNEGSVDADLKQHILRLDSSLNKLPHYKDSLLYRGEDFDGYIKRVIDRISSGMVDQKDIIFTCKSYISTTVLKNSCFLHKNIVYTLFKNKSARNISHVSAFENEAEVLFPRECNFILISVENDHGTGKTIVQMAEV
jgi:hypothetical protein